MEKTKTFDEQTVKKIDINKEIVLLRQPVRKARIKVISKLTREAKKLRAKRGDEKQLEKNKRKADKLGREIIALKPVKHDEISKFGIFHLETLQKTAQDISVPDVTRVIAKVANHKSLAPRIEDFRRKFPDYEKYISVKKQKSKSKKKKTEEPKSKASKKATIVTTQVASEEKNKNDSESDEENNCNEHSDSDPDKGSSSSGEDSDTKNNVISQKTSTPKSIPQKLPKILHPSNNNEGAEEANFATDESSKPIKVISKEATVKRFTEILTQDTEDVAEDQEALPQQGGNTEIQKAVDDFFMSANGNGHHLVTVPLAPVNDSSIHFTEKSKDRYFSKISSNKPVGRPFSNDRNWESIPKGKGKWNVANSSTQYKGPRDTHRQDFKNRNEQPQDKKLKKNDDLKNTQENESLHPSWQARKKQQEIMKKGFQGKKIVFDDE